MLKTTNFDGILLLKLAKRLSETVQGGKLRQKDRLKEQIAMNKILIFGDSNTWGYVPPNGTRYPRDVRWPGVAASLLGESYEIVEDAVSGRTTIYEDPMVPKRCGIDNLGYSLCAHYPLDLVVLFIGTNDLKFTDAEGFRKGLTRLIDTILHAQELFHLEHPIFREEKKRLLVVGPPRINPEIPRVRPNHPLSRAAEPSKALSGIARQTAEQFGAAFVDAAGLVFPDTTDCMHLKPEDHRILGTALAQAIRAVFEGGDRSAS